MTIALTPNTRVDDSKPLKIGFTFDSVSSWLALGYTLEQCAEFYDDVMIDAMAASLSNLGTVDKIGGVKALAKRLAESNHDWDLVFNFAEGYGTVGREAQVPALLEAWGIPFTFSDSATMALCLDKAKTKMVIEHYGIPTAPFATIPPRSSWPKSGFNPLDVIDNSAYRDELQTYPLFIKPASASTGIGICGKNKVYSREELVHAIEKLSKLHPTISLLVEQFLPGREFTVGIVGTGQDAQVVGVREFVFLKQNPNYHIDLTITYVDQDTNLMETDVYSDVLKRNHGRNPQRVSLGLDDPVALSIAEVALNSWRVLGCRDGGRIDIRQDSKSIPNFIEVNTLPGLMPNVSDFPLLAEANGIDYDRLMSEIVHSALKRYG